MLCFWEKTAQVPADFVTLVVQWLVCLPLDQQIAGSNPAKRMNF
jgi:hypothetical protein